MNTVMTRAEMAVSPETFDTGTEDAMAGNNSSRLEYEAGLRPLVLSLESAQDILQRAAASHSYLAAPARALGRVARAARRPLRLAILGESNSGKSSLANLLAGETALPALPVANTRLPTLLRYAPAAFACALFPGGARHTLSGSTKVQAEPIIRVEVGLPIEMLKRVEILDFPGSANPLFPTGLLDVLRHGIDAAVWATVATQAWRETERIAWLALPKRIRSRGLLVVTHCDLIATGEDFRRLQARLKSDAVTYFQRMSFVSARHSAAAVSAQPLDAAKLSGDIDWLAQAFLAGRLNKAVAITRRLAGQALERLGDETANC
jgi:50S ribosome-binding GTPase